MLRPRQDVGASAPACQVIAVRDDIICFAELADLKRSEEDDEIFLTMDRLMA